MSEAKHLVFVSYAAEDKAIADAVCAAIESVGVPCWIAPRDIVTGSNWAKSIMHGISSSKLMVLIFSKQTNASPHVRREIERAVHHDVPIAPLRVEDILPEEDLEYFLSSQHWSDLFPGPVEQKVREIPDKVCRLLGVTPVAPKPPPPLPSVEIPAPTSAPVLDPKPPAPPVDRAPVEPPSKPKPPPLPIAPVPTPTASPAPAPSALPAPVSPRMPATSTMPVSSSIFSWRNIAIVSGTLFLLLVGLILLGWHLESKEEDEKASQADASLTPPPAPMKPPAPNPLDDDTKLKTPAPVDDTGSKQWAGDLKNLKSSGAAPPPPADWASLPQHTANSLFMKFVLIRPGTFTMGDDTGFADEKPAHRVTLTQPFYLQECEVTQGHWRAIMGTTPQQQRDAVNPAMPMPGEGDNLPMYFVSWDDTEKFCQRLSSIEGKNYRLPTEAEWEYACRAGSSGSYCFGSNINQLNDYGWSVVNSTGLVHALEGKNPNAWGLYDMHGNVWEWCSDIYGDYLVVDQTDPTGLSFVGTKHVLRGGSWANKPQYCRSAIRLARASNMIGNDAGFRVVMGIQ